MTLIVHSWGAYASYHTPIWRPEDYIVNKVVKALKGKEFKGYAQFKDTDGLWRRVESGGRDEALRVFVAWGRRLFPHPIPIPVVFVPVPCSSCVNFGDSSAPVAMADALARRIGAGAEVGNWLRFARAMQPSHEGGGRNQSVLEAALEVDRDAVKPGATVVLVDDVKTTGSHLKACASALRASGCTVGRALTAATTVWDRVPHPLEITPESLEPNPRQSIFDDLFE